MVHSKNYIYDLKLQYSYDMYKYIYQFEQFKFNSNSIRWCLETECSIKPWLVAIVAALVWPLIPIMVASW